MKKNEIVFKSILMGLIVMFAYFAVASVQAESEVGEGVVRGKLVLPEGVEIPEGMKVGIYYSDFEWPPEPNPLPSLTPVPTSTVVPEPRGVEKKQFVPPQPPEGPEKPDIPQLDTFIYEAPLMTTDVLTSTGEFQFPSIPSGVYVLNLIPPEGSYLMTPSTVYIEVFQSDNNLGGISVVEAQLSGSLINPIDETIVEGYITVIDQTGSYYQTVRTVNGRYFMRDIPAGDYGLQAIPSAYQSGFFESDIIAMTIGDETDTIVQSISINGPDLYGIVLDPSGDPYVNSEVSVISADDGPFVSKYTYVNNDGEWSIGGLRDGVYQLSVSNYRDFNDSDVLRPEPIEITVPNEDLPILMQYEYWPIGLKVVSGQLVDGLDNPVTDGIIYARDYDRGLNRSTVTDFEGNFSLDLIGGVWDIEIYPLDYDSVDWVNFAPATVVEFAANDAEEMRNVSIKVSRYDATLTGEIVSIDPDLETPSHTVVLSSKNYGFSVSTYRTPGKPFVLNAPAGNYYYSIYLDGYAFAPIEDGEVTLVSGQTADLGIFEISGPRSKIQGKILTTAGDPAPNIPVIAYNQTMSDFERRGVTDEDGNYEIDVYAGVHSVSPLTYDSFYFHDGSYTEVSVGEDETVGVDFIVQAQNSTIVGRILDAEGEVLLSADGWVSISSLSPEGFYASAPIDNGAFEIQTIAGDLKIYVDVYDFSRFFPSVVTVSVEDGATAEIEIQELPSNATIIGNLVDFRTGETLLGISGNVHGSSPDVSQRVSTSINPEVGSYELPVRDGVWSLLWDAYPAPESEYRQVGNYVPEVQISENSTFTFDLPMVLQDASVSGHVVDSAGESVSHVNVQFEGQNELSGFTSYARSDSSGNFSANLPYGSYIVHVPYFEFADDYPPEPMMLTLEPEEDLIDYDIQFRKADSPLTMSFFAPGLTSGGDLYVTVSSRYGAYYEFSTHLSSDGEHGVATLSELFPDGTWYISANAYFEEGYWAGGGLVIIDGTTDVQIEMSETGGDPVGGRVEFEDGKALELVIENGASVLSQAGFLPEGSGIKNISLIAGNFFPVNGQMAPVGLSYWFYGDDGYNTLDSIEFASPVTVTLPYGESILDFAEPSELRIMFYEANPLGSLDSLVTIEDVVIDEVNRTLSFEVNQFGYIGVMVPAELMPVRPTFEDLFGNSSYFSIVRN